MASSKVTVIYPSKRSRAQNVARQLSFFRHRLFQHLHPKGQLVKITEEDLFKYLNQIHDSLEEIHNLGNEIVMPPRKNTHTKP